MIYYNIRYNTTLCYATLYYMNLYYIRTAVSSQDVRQQLFDDGLNVALEFIVKKGGKTCKEEEEEKEKEKEKEI